MAQASTGGSSTGRRISHLSASSVSSSITASVNLAAVAQRAKKTMTRFFEDDEDDDDDDDSNNVKSAPTNWSNMRNEDIAERPSVSTSRTTFSLESLPPELCVGIRGCVYRVITSQNFSFLIGLTIVANIGLMVYETDQNAACVTNPDSDACESAGIDLGNHIFLGVYTMEFLIRLYVFRCPGICGRWNLLDLWVVIIGYMDIALGLLFADEMPGPSLSLLRVFRVMRLLRAVKIFRKIPELHAMMRGFLSAMRSMFWGLVMVIIVMLLFSILSVELINPMSQRIHADNEYCREAFGTIWYCMIMFFQTLVAGDSWGDCVIPVVKDQWWSFGIFACALVCVQLGFLSLILAVIVEQASRAAQEDDDAIRKDKARSERRATNMLCKLFASIDTDNSGTISLQELMEGFDSNEDFNNLFARLDMGRSDVELLFELMDADDRGELSYDYMIDNLKAALNGNDQMSLRMIRLQAAEIARCVKRVHCRTSTLLTGARPPRYSYARARQSRRVPTDGVEGEDIGLDSLPISQFQSMQSYQSQVTAVPATGPSSVKQNSSSIPAEGPDVEGLDSAAMEPSGAYLPFGGSDWSFAQSAAGASQPSVASADSQVFDSHVAFSQEVAALRAVLEGDLLAKFESIMKLNDSVLVACQASSSYQCQSIQKILDMMKSTDSKEHGLRSADSKGPGQHIANTSQSLSMQPPGAAFEPLYGSETSSGLRFRRPSDPALDMKQQQQQQLASEVFDGGLRDAAFGSSPLSATNGHGGGTGNPSFVGSTPCNRIRRL